MKDKRLLFGVAITAAWLAPAAWMFFNVEHPAKLNEWGDFFAGFFAPLAFLWLVLGYLQQGEELKHSTEALRLQAEELRNAVAQQTQLVEVSRQQLEHEHAVREEEREVQRDAARPKLHLSCDGHRGTAEAHTFQMRLRNLGAPATHVSVSADGIPAEVYPDGQSLLDRNGEFIFDYRTPSDSTVMTVSYIGADGAPGRVEFGIEKVGGIAGLAVGLSSRVL